MSANTDRVESARRQRHVLLVDGDVAVRDAIASALCSENYAVIAVGNPEDAVLNLVNHPIDVALVGLDGTGKDGWETLRRLDAADGRLPILLLTAQPDLVAHPLASRARACFQKPLLNMRVFLGMLSAVTA